MKPLPFQKDTQAWIAQVWIAFIASVLFSTLGILYAPIEEQTKGYLAVSFLFTMSSSFTLAKTIRDNQEAARLFSRLDEARIEKILAEHGTIDKL
ncbi:YiaA/YiaB family inner membrane protein [Thermostichus vulcanus]|nr:YiaA/YiaB family inner membrane protein [Thermostichus vulcanus]